MASSFWTKDLLADFFCKRSIVEEALRWRSMHDQGINFRKFLMEPTKVFFAYDSFKYNSYNLSAILDECTQPDPPIGNIKKLIDRACDKYHYGKSDFSFFLFSNPFQLKNSEFWKRRAVMYIWLIVYVHCIVRKQSAARFSVNANERKNRASSEIAN